MLARAKINLYLHVDRLDNKGFHPLQSLVMFADIGDELVWCDPQNQVLSIDGLFSEGLSSGEDNLILKAVRIFERSTGKKLQDRGLRLTKNLPLASGLGGGSADAGAALRLLHEEFTPDMPLQTLSEMAAKIGSDGAMCLWSKSAIASGYGEILRPIDTPKLQAVLINPKVECSTRDVYSGFDAIDHNGEIDTKSSLYETNHPIQLIENLKETRNDLQEAAIKTQPIIAEVLETLGAQKEVLLSRMSGSGATCFALCATPDDARSLAQKLKNIWPNFWIMPCGLG